MKGLFFLLVIVGVLLYLVKKQARKTAGSTTTDEPYPYKSRERLCTEAEAAFFEKLRQAPPEHHIFAQVQMLRIMEVRAVENAKSWQNKIDRKSLDFVICDANHAIVAGIELDDSTHSQKKRQDRDVFVERAMRDAGIKLARFHAREVITADGIRERILGAAPSVQG